ncbi:MAG: AsmA-like C-terminal domain-containing protein [Campylobacterota bacterium]|nr:AsmA-like C-terminal domain-containing protein [Campylobacterota bacterium]
MLKKIRLNKSVIKKIFLTIFILLIVSIMVVFFKLNNGISIKEFSNSSANIKEIFIQYDDKLTLIIDTVEIIPSKEESKPIDIKAKYLKYAKTLLENLELISIKHILVANQDLNLKFKNNKLIIKNKDIEINTSFDILKYDVIINSKLSLIDEKVVSNAFLKLNIFTNQLDYKMSTNSITNLKFIEKYTKLAPDIQKLINEQLEFQDIIVKDISGFIDINKPEKLNLDKVKANVVINNLSLKYNQYPKVAIKDINITFQDKSIVTYINKVQDTKVVSLDGTITSSIDGKNISVNSKIFYKDLVITNKEIIEDDILEYNLSIDEFKDINTFSDFVEFPASIKKWAIDRLTTKSVEIKNISGIIYLKDFFVDMGTLRVDGVLNDIVMDFNPKRAYPLEAKTVKLNFDGRDMNINLTNPISNDVNLDGSSATIYDMFNKSGLLLELQTISPLNETLVRSVASYDVNIVRELAIAQLKGKSDIKVKIDIPFTNNPIDIFVDIKNKNSIIAIKDNNISFDIFDFKYKNKQVIINKSLAKYQNYNIDIDNLLFDIPKKELDLDILAYDNNNTFKAGVINYTNLDKNITKGKIDIAFVDINNSVSIKDEIIPYDGVFGDSINMNLPTLGINYNKKENIQNFSIKELLVFKDFIIPMEKIPLKSSYLDINIKDNKDINIKLNGKSMRYFDKLKYDILLSTNINLDKNTTNGNLDISKLSYKNITDINNTIIPFNGSFSNENKIFNLPTLGFEFVQSDTNYIRLEDINKLSKIVTKIDDFNLTKTSIKVKTDNFNDLNISTKTDISIYPIYLKDKKLDELNLDIKIKDKKHIDIKDDKGLISGNVILDDIQNIDINLSNLGIVYKEDNTTKKKEKPTIIYYPKCKNIDFNLPIINLNIDNGYLKYNNHQLIYDNITLKTNQENIDFSLDKNKTKLLIEIENRDVNLSIKNIDKDFLNTLANKTIINQGNIDLDIFGTQCNLDGKLIMRDINVKEAKILKNIFLIINTTPALINPLLVLPNAYRFATDKLNLSQYSIKKGLIDFNYNRDKDVVMLNTLYTQGIYSDFLASGKINLRKKKIDTKLDIIFMKDYSKIIGYIPIVGYIILGDDKRISYSVDIKGKLTEPEIKTHLLKETTTAPLNMIKRVITLPLVPFQDKDKE